jgi:hypothetical protein
MKKSCTISDYCLIRNNSVVVNNNILYSGQSAGFGEFSAAVYKHFSVNYPKFHKMDNLSKLGFLSADLLLRDKNINLNYDGDEIGIILMNSSSSLDTDRHHQNSINNRANYFPSPAVFVYTLPNVVIGEICIRHKLYGEGNFFIMEEFNSTFLVSYVQQLFDSGIIQCCITGWVELGCNDYESMVLLIEKTGRTDLGIANFEAATVQNIFDKMK